MVEQSRRTNRAYGVLAEDRTDCDVVRVFIRRILADDSVKVRARSGKGCARLRRKAEPFMRDLVAAGCTRLIVLHDLDRNPNNDALNDHDGLRRELEGLKVPDQAVRL